MTLRRFYRYIAWRLFDFGLRRFGRVDGPDVNVCLWLALTAAFNFLTLAQSLEATTGWRLGASVGQMGFLALAVALFLLHYQLLVRSGAIEALDEVTVEWSRTHPRLADLVFWGYLLGSMILFFGVGALV